MQIILNPIMKLDKHRFKIDNNNGLILNISFNIREFPLSPDSTLSKETNTYLSCFEWIQLDRLFYTNKNYINDLTEIGDLQINEDTLNKYFCIKFPLSERSIPFKSIDNLEYKKFILNNLNRAIMEYSL